MDPIRIPSVLPSKRRRSGQTGVPKLKLKSAKDKKFKLHIVLQGFKDQSLITPIELSAFLDEQIPPEHLRQLNRVIFKPKTTRLIEALYASIQRLGLWQVPFKERIITIFKKSNLDDFYWALCHELGHLVFDTVLTNAQRYQWLHGISDKTGGLTPYSGKSPYEDFAESYAAFVLRKDLINQCHRRKAFIAELFPTKAREARFF